MNNISAKYEYEVTSPQNEKFKFLVRLTKGKELKHEDFFLVSGKKLVAEFLDLQARSDKPWAIHAEVTSNLTDSPRQSKAPLWFLDKKLFSEVDAIQTHFNLLVVKKPELAAVDLTTAPQGMEVIVPLGDPGNLGAVLRSCEAFGASKVILTTEAAQIFLPKVVKAASGSLFRLEFRKGPGLKDFAAAAGPLISLDSTGESILKYKWPKNFRLLIGEEGPGIPKTLNTQNISIPMLGTESLNATVAASIAMFHARSQHGEGF